MEFKPPIASGVAQPSGFRHRNRSSRARFCGVAIEAPATAPIGIALSGGGACSLAQLGVIDYLVEEERIAIGAVAGTSAGAVMGAMVAAGRGREFVRAMGEITWRRMFDYFRIAHGGGSMLDFESALEFLGGFLSPDIESLAIPYAEVATDLVTGAEVVTRSGSIVDALAGSCSVPGIFPPLRSAGGWLADGALVNPLPVSVARVLGASFVIAIDVSLGSRIADVHAALRHVEFFASLRRWLAVWGLSRPRFADMRPGEHPDVDAVLRKAEDALARSAAGHDVANVLPPDFTITVPLAGFRVFDFHRANELVELGRAAAGRTIGELRATIAARAS